MMHLFDVRTICKADPFYVLVSILQWLSFSQIRILERIYLLHLIGFLSVPFSSVPFFFTVRLLLFIESFFVGCIKDRDLHRLSGF